MLTRHPELVSGSRLEMLNQVQHDGVVVTSLRIPPLRHPELVSGSRLSPSTFQGLVFEMLNRVQHDGVGGC